MEHLGDMSVALFLVSCLAVRACSQQQGPQVPCLFIFGDSLVDNGNNNRMLTLARANYRPYGIDFPLGVTGRFTNGRTYVDALGTLSFYFHFLPVKTPEKVSSEEKEVEL